MRLYDYLKINKIRISVAAKKLKMDRTRLSAICHMRIFPSKKVAKKLCKFTKGEVTVEEFYPEGYFDKKRCPTCGHEYTKREKSSEFKKIRKKFIKQI